MANSEVIRAPRADAERNRLRILQAATDVFAECGISATLNDVARAAGVGVATVYRRFPNKEAMFDALFDDKLATLVRVAQTASEIEDPGAAIRTFLFGVIQARATDRGFDAILTASGQNTRYVQELGRQFLPTAHGLIDRAIAAGELRADFTGPEIPLLGLMVGKVADVTRVSHPNLWQRYAQLVIDGTRPAAGTERLSPVPLLLADVAAALGRAG